MSAQQLLLRTQRKDQFQGNEDQLDQQILRYIDGASSRLFRSVVTCQPAATDNTRPSCTLTLRTLLTLRLLGVLVWACRTELDQMGAASQGGMMSCRAAYWQLRFRCDGFQTMAQAKLRALVPFDT